MSQLHFERLRLRTMRRAARAGTTYRLHKDHIPKDIMECSAPLLKHPAKDLLKKSAAAFGRKVVSQPALEFKWLGYPLCLKNPFSGSAHLTPARPQSLWELPQASYQASSKDSKPSEVVQELAEAP